MNQDLAACEAKLGQEPVLPSEKNGTSVTLSESMTERLKTGVVDDGRLEKYDNYWIEKLACIDEAHSVRNNLDIEEAQQTLQRLLGQGQLSSETKHPAAEYDSAGVSSIDRDKVRWFTHKSTQKYIFHIAILGLELYELQNCFEMFRGETLRCRDNIDKFIQQVDRTMYEAVRKNHNDR